MREIGSEYHSVAPDSGPGLIFPRPGSLVFSGRAAIAAVLRCLPDAHTALLPAYCCDAMIDPFRAAGIDVRFYKVDWDNGLKVEINEGADILLWCNYFGFSNKMPDFDGVIIEDITHSLLSDSSFHPRSDYLVASLRKWEPVICGGYCSVTVNGTPPPDAFVKEKKRAMERKAEYLQHPQAEKKNGFLRMFGKNNHWLAENYSGLLIDAYSQNYIRHADIEKQKSIRRENAKALYAGLSGKVQFMFPEQEMDCPLFVPIMLPAHRDEVRARLIKDEIYCPVHWPKAEGCESNIYGMELSLICDQRYGLEDMERIVSTLEEVI